ncbi:MAG: hypothetical protein CFE28_06435 [Alphaproteobacteria bacterium PA2]|nr:MAG: hypothetical protein CFE28_06435 [Alphaproteobacteria bacterium PA2]
MIDQTLTLADGRTVGFSDYGKAGDAPVIWCHGGPGSRLEAAAAGVAVQALGLRVISIDRPGYGLSSLNTGRSIADWSPDCLAVADALGVDTFMTAGMSTGGAYALSVAANAPDRVKAVVTGCAMTDMRHPEARASMPGPTTHGVWDAPSREAALAIAADTFGEDGGRMMGGLEGLPEADMVFLTHPDYAAGAEASRAAMFANGVQAYVDDRLADGVGWVSFDVGKVRCPVIIVHGESDTIVPVVAAHHTASLIPQAELRLFRPLGHFSVGEPVVAALVELAHK